MSRNAWPLGDQSWRWDRQVDQGKSSASSSCMTKSQATCDRLGSCPEWRFSVTNYPGLDHWSKERKPEEAPKQACCKWRGMHDPSYSTEANHSSGCSLSVTYINGWDQGDSTICHSKVHQIAALNGCHRDAACQGWQWMQFLLQDCFWWPGMVNQIQRMVKNCKRCIWHIGA